MQTERQVNNAREATEVQSHWALRSERFIAELNPCYFREFLFGAVMLRFAYQVCANLKRKCFIRALPMAAIAFSCWPSVRLLQALGE